MRRQKTAETYESGGHAPLSLPNGSLHWTVSRLCEESTPNSIRFSRIFRKISGLDGQCVTIPHSEWWWSRLLTGGTPGAITHTLVLRKPESPASHLSLFLSFILFFFVFPERKKKIGWKRHLRSPISAQAWKIFSPAYACPCPPFFFQISKQYYI